MSRPLAMPVVRASCWERSVLRAVRVGDARASGVKRARTWVVSESDAGDVAVGVGVGDTGRVTRLLVAGLGRLWDRGEAGVVGSPLLCVAGVRKTSSGSSSGRVVDEAWDVIERALPWPLLRCAVGDVMVSVRATFRGVSYSSSAEARSASSSDQLKSSMSFCGGGKGGGIASSLTGDRDLVDGVGICAVILLCTAVAFPMRLGVRGSV
jgi:hypothetical protein